MLLAVEPLVKNRIVRIVRISVKNTSQHVIPVP